VRQSGKPCNEVDIYDKLTPKIVFIPSYDEVVAEPMPCTIAYRLIAFGSTDKAWVPGELCSRGDDDGLEKWAYPHKKALNQKQNLAFSTAYKKVQKLNPCSRIWPYLQDWKNEIRT